ncbi:hypothetical protein [Petrachloros mirabilis]
MVIQLTEQPTISAGDTELMAVDFQDQLDSGELLTGTPTIAEQGTSALTITNKAVSTAALTINGRSCAIGQAVQCLISGQAAGTTYTVRITVSTDATPARTFVRDATFVGA